MAAGTTITVYVPQLNEGTSTWRPTQAVLLSKQTVRLLPTERYDLEDETWEFTPGTVVRIEAQELSDGAKRSTEPVAVAIAE